MQHRRGKYIYPKLLVNLYNTHPAHNVGEFYRTGYRWDGNVGEQAISAAAPDLFIGIPDEHDRYLMALITQIASIFIAVQSWNFVQQKVISATLPPLA